MVYSKDCKLIREELRLAEDIAVEEANLEKAEVINAEINDLQEKEILLRNFMIIEENQRAVS